MAAEVTRYAVEVPYLGSIILTHHLYGHIPGLRSFARDDRPDATVVFWTFRIMVGLGFLILLLGVVAHGRAGAALSIDRDCFCASPWRWVPPAWSPCWPDG